MCNTTPWWRSLTHLDGLRGIAALLVLYFHVLTAGVAAYGTTNGIEYWAWYPTTSVIDLGKTGVAAFFAISGFVIPLSFAHKKRPVAGFLLSRFFRLYPVYWCSLIAAIAARYVVGSTPAPFATVLANVTMAQTLFGEPDVVGVYWTLFVELLFYGLCLIAFCSGVLHSRYHALGGCILFVGLAVCATLHADMRSYATPLLGLAVMTWSALYRQTRSSDVPDRLPGLGLACIILALPWIYGYGGDTQSAIRYTLSYSVGIGAFLACIRYKLGSSPALVWVGTVSYSVYLFHTLIGAVVLRVMTSIADVRSPHLVVLVATIATLIGAAATFYSVERPSMALAAWARRRLAG